MRKLIVITLVLAGVWAGYWWVGASGAERAFAAWFDDRRTKGWVAEYDDLNVRGFPNRFDTVITGLSLADPDTGLAWDADEFQILALSYKPNHVIAVWPGVQRLSNPEQKIDITADDFKGSLVVDPAPNLPLTRATFVLENMSLASSAGWKAHLDSGQLATRLTEVDTNTHEVFFEARNLIPASGFVQSLGPDSVLPPVFEGVTVKANIGFSAPWDRFAIERARPQPRHLDLSLLTAKWGEMDVKMSGTLEIDAAGVPTGELAIKANNWRQMIAVAETSGAIAPEFVSTLTGALQFVAGLSGNRESLDVTLGFSGGYVTLGPIPIGRAPVLKIR